MRFVRQVLRVAEAGNLYNKTPAIVASASSELQNSDDIHLRSDGESRSQRTPLVVRRGVYFPVVRLQQTRLR